MRGCLPAVLLALLTSVSIFATDIQAGPWLQLRPDGGCRVVIESRLPLDGPSLRRAVLQPVDKNLDQDGAWSLPEQIAIQRPMSEVSRLLSWRVPADLPAGTRLSVTIDTTTFEVRVPGRPAMDAEASVLIASGNAYPDEFALEELAEELGRPVQAVWLLAGRSLAWRLGRGGWEDEIPFLVIGAGPADQQALCADRDAWQSAFAWGRLGVTTARGDGLEGVRFAQDLSPWRLVLDTEGLLELGMPRHFGVTQPGITVSPQRQLGQVSSATEPLTMLIRATHAQAMPLIIGAGGSQACITDPLGYTTDGSLRSVPGGTRYLLFDAESDEPKSFPMTVNRPLPQGLSGVLRTAGDHLHLSLHKQGKGWRRDLHWQRWPEDPHPDLRAEHTLVDTALLSWRQRGKLAEQNGRRVSWVPLQEIGTWGSHGREVREMFAAHKNGHALWQGIEKDLKELYPWPMDGLDGATAWGIGHVAALDKRWRGVRGDEPTDQDDMAAAAADLAWMPTDHLFVSMRDEVVRERLFERAVTTDVDMLYPLLSCFPEAGASWLRSREEADPVWQRWVLLRYLGDGYPIDSRPFAQLIEICRDPVSLRAIIRIAQDKRRWRLQAYLRNRLQAQVAGRLPLDEDELLQYRLLSAVLGCPYLSPTPLRQLALDLEDRVKPLGQQAIERFFERYGRHRPNH